MKTPLNWISLYTPLETLLSQKSPTELAHIYSTHTAEIDGIEYHDIDLVVIGKVLSYERHPESKKLSICEVQIARNTPLPPFEGGQEQSVRTTLEGEQESSTPVTPEERQEQTTIILTGAPNIATGQYVPVALVGCQLAPDFVIGERRMAGMMSRGMICGADEIGLSTESDGGIMVLEDTWDRDLLESMIGQSLWDLRLPFP
jgi:phenylalanyl-tRNA synthetase beta chain